MKYVILISTVLLCGLSQAYADDLTWDETMVYTLTVADWLQTRQIKDHPELEEASPVTKALCGKNPDELCLGAWVSFKLWHMYRINNEHFLRNAKMFNGKIKFKTFVNTIYSSVHVYAVRNGLKLGLEIRW